MPAANKSKRTSARQLTRTKRAVTRKSAAASRSLGPKARLGARTEFRIYPSIGIARMGNCKESFMIGPESPGLAPKISLRGADGGLKPQGARFRIYQVEIDANENETVVGEVIAGPKTAIDWSVNLANRKAAGFRIADTLARKPNPRLRNDGYDRKKLVISAAGSVAGIEKVGPTLAGSIEFSKPRAQSVVVAGIELATLRTDEAGRLIVVGGLGVSGSPFNSEIPSFSDNDGWYDSVSDGPVFAKLRIRGVDHAVIPAWVVVTVPRYAPETYGIVTWYDQAVSMARTGADGSFDAPRTTSFTRDIFPMLKRADDLSGVHGLAHANGAIRPLSDNGRISGFSSLQARAAILSKLAPVGTAASGPEVLPQGLMPFLYSGANPDPDPNGPIWAHLSLTRYQMAHLVNWINGNFDDDWTGSAPEPLALDKIPVDRQPRALCEAALETCIGGSFFPGIEGTYDITRLATYHEESHLRREFRINPGEPAGFLTEKMALPWQADFADCADYWWPSQRPVNVTTADGKKVRWDRDIVGTTKNAHLNMVAHWTQLGLVVRDDNTGKYVEKDRQPF